MGNIAERAAIEKTSACSRFPAAMQKRVNSAALALRRASPPHPFSKGLSGMKLPRCAGKCCTRRCAAQIPARRAKFEPDPSCVCRWDTSVVQQSRMSCASPYIRRQEYAFQKSRVCPVSDSGARFCLAAAQHAANGIGPCPRSLDADARAFLDNRTFHQ